MVFDQLEQRADVAGRALSAASSTSPWSRDQLKARRRTASASARSTSPSR